MNLKGDSKRQALLRDEMIKKTEKTSRSRYVSAVLSILKQQMKLLDIGCGTAHIIQEVATRNLGSHLVGLDVSPAMLKMANANITGLPNVELVEGDGFNLPFPDCTFSIIITRLADYSPKEAYRVLKENGYFLECSLGPEADKEIKEFFPERIEKENFFFPKNLDEWKQEVCEPITKAGFTVSTIRDHKEEEYHESLEDLMDLIEMVPLVKDFDRIKDRKRIGELAEKFRTKMGVRTTWHYYILIARKS
jgi:ubiquinone/menaquinone biosynthesis C-methylase UbiE